MTFDKIPCMRFWDLFQSRIVQNKKIMHPHPDLTIKAFNHLDLIPSRHVYTNSQDKMQVLNKTKYAFFLTMTLLVGSGSSVHTTPLKLRQIMEAYNKPVGPTDDGINKKKSMKNPAPSAQPSAFPSTMPSSQPTQKKSAKGMMKVSQDKPSY